MKGHLTSAMYWDSLTAVASWRVPHMLGDTIGRTAAHADHAERVGWGGVVESVWL